MSPTARSCNRVWKICGKPTAIGTAQVCIHVARQVLTSAIQSCLDADANQCKSPTTRMFQCDAFIVEPFSVTRLLCHHNPHVYVLASMPWACLQSLDCSLTTLYITTSITHHCASKNVSYALNRVPPWQKKTGKPSRLK